ncbi:MAG: DUF1611 domain-containing protein [Thermoplasmata archaeon]
MKKAVILTDGYLDRSAAKTSHGLLRKSKKYDIVGVLDSKFAGNTTDQIIKKSNKVKIYRDIESILKEEDVDVLIVGVATIGGYLPENFKVHIEHALEHGISIISGLHDYLGENERFSRLAEENSAEIIDIRRSPPIEELHYFQNRKKEINALTIPFLGTDSSIGKRTSMLEVYEKLREDDVDAVWIATGQTGLLQGADYGLPLDSIKGDYMVGELEHQIWKAWREKKPDVILIEGQGSISHPAYVCGSRAVLAASQPDGVVLVHAPARKYRHYKEDEIRWPMPSVEHEMELIKLFSGADTICICINPEDMGPDELKRTIEEYEGRFDIPCTDALQDPEKICDRIKKLISEQKKN